MDYFADLQALLKFPKDLREATDYTKDYIIHGSSWGSEEFHKDRAAFVQQAERYFVNQYKKEILEIAAQLAEDRIRDLIDILSDHIGEQGKLEGK